MPNTREKGPEIPLRAKTTQRGTQLGVQGDNGLESKQGGGLKKGLPPCGAGVAYGTMPQEFYINLTETRPTRYGTCYNR
jgi:hypothetical protein